MVPQDSEDEYIDLTQEWAWSQIEKRTGTDRRVMEQIAEIQRREQNRRAS